MQASSSRIENTVERILENVESRQGSREYAAELFEASNGDRSQNTPSNYSGHEFGGKLSVQDLSQLGLLCSEPQQYRNDDWSNVDVDYLITLCPMLEQHVVSASHVDLIGEALKSLNAKCKGGDDEGCSLSSVHKTAASPLSLIDLWLNPQANGEGFTRVSVLRCGMEAANILLSIMNTPNMDRRIVSEDGIQACISLLRQHINKNVIHALSQSGHMIGISSLDSGTTTESSKSPKKKRRKYSKGRDAQPQDKLSDEVIISSETRKHLISALKKVYKLILTTVGLLSLLLERTQALVNFVQLDDRPLLSLTSSALSTLTIDPRHDTTNNSFTLSHIVQVSAMSLLLSIFRRYSRHRTVILEDLFPLMLKLPTSKKSMRTFRTRNFLRSSTTANAYETSGSSDNSIFIQPVAALILSLVQGSVTMPVMKESKESSGQSSNPDCSKDTTNTLSNGVLDCVKVSDFFARNLLHRCARKGEDGGASEFRPILSNLIDDFLQLHLVPEYPAADMLLFAICRRISHDLLKCSSHKNSSNNSNTVLETTYIATAMDALGKVCAKIAMHLLSYKQSPMILNQERKLSAHNDSSEEEVRCFCGRTDLVDTFMLDCDRCHAWFHGSCVDVTKDNLPRVWICDNCKMQMIVLEQTHKIKEHGHNGKKKSDQARNIGDVHIFRQLLLNHMSYLAEGVSSCGKPDSIIENSDLQGIHIAREFHLAKWIEEQFSIQQQCLKNEAAGRSTTKQDEKLSLLMENSNFKIACFMEQWQCGLSLHNDDNIEMRGCSSTALDSHRLSKRSLVQNLQEQQLSLGGNNKLMLSLAAKTYDLTKNFPHLLGVLVQLMGDDLVSLRKLSVKAISQAIQVDPNLMIQPAVRDAVSRRFSDESISVREAAVSLVGSFVLQAPMVAETFHMPILARLNDKGISVRKRAVRIFRDVLLSFPNYGGRASACSKMLQLAADPKEDDGVRDLIHETFKDLWFNEESFTNLQQFNFPEHPGTPVDNGIRPNTVTPECPFDSSTVRRGDKRKKDAEINAAKIKSRFHAAAMQMVEVVASSDNIDFLTKLFKDLLFGVIEGKGTKAREREKRKDAVNSHCGNLVASLMDELLAFEEGRSTIKIPVGDSSEKKSFRARQLVAIISTLGTFGDASPGLLVSHLDTILPYLKADNGMNKDDEAVIVHNVCRLVTRVVPLLCKAEMLRLSNSDVILDLEKVTYKFGSVTLSSAVEALACLAGQDTDGLHSQRSLANKKILKLANTFYSYLFQEKYVADDLGGVKPGVRNNIHRALSVLGSICRFFEIPPKDDGAGYTDPTTSDDPTNCPFLKPSLLNESNLYNACFSCASWYLFKHDPSTKCCALRALSGMFIARPRAMLYAEQLGTIEKMMDDDAPTELQHEALLCWKEIILAEEHRIETGAAKEKMDSKKDITISKRISGDQDGDSSLAGGVMTQHCSRLFQLTKSLNSTIRFATVDLIGHLLRQGLINPMETIPHLLALQGDVGAPEIRTLARKLIIIEGEKRPDMLRQRICAGVRQAFLFQRVVYPNSERITAIVEEVNGSNQNNDGKDIVCIFGSIFLESIKTSRVQRQGLIRSLLTLFTNVRDRIHNRSDASNTTTGYSPGKVDVYANSPLKSNRKESTLDGGYLQQLPLLSYAVQILAHLPYTASADPLYAIHIITGIATLQGAELLDRFRDFLMPFGLANSEDDDIDHAMVDVLEGISKNKGGDWNAAVDLMRSTSFKLTQFIEMSAEASSLILLLRLKNFLKKVYNLSDTRCIEYSPIDKERICDKTIRVPDRMPRFNNDIGIAASIYSNPKWSENVDVIRDPDLFSFIVLYGEFRELMRQGDNAVERTVHDSEKYLPEGEKNDLKQCGRVSTQC